MPAITSFVLNDALATPVAHTFAPARQGFFNGHDVAEYEDRAVNGGSPSGFNRVSLSLSRPNRDRKSYRLSVKVSTPIMETISNSTASGIAPAPTVAYTLLADMSFVIPDRAVPQNRKDLRKFVRDLFNDPASPVLLTIENLDFPY
jgi:hypothetical protein